MSSSPLYFFEQTDFSLRLARSADGERPLRIAEVKEVSLADAAELIANVPANASVACALRPKVRALHLATADEAKLHHNLASVLKFAERPLTAGAANLWFAAVQAHDGRALSGAPWLLATSPEVQPHTAVGLGDLKAKPIRCASATLATIGALARTAAQPVLLIEVGELTSHAILVGREGVVTVGTVTLDLNRIAESVQAELELKFRGSAVKLFFNAEYDFSDVGPKIAARLAPGIKSELDQLLANRPGPAALLVAGLPAAQQWFGPQLANALGLATYTPDYKSWSNVTGVTFSTAELMASLSPAWFGTLDFVHAATLTKAPGAASWIAEWTSLTNLAAVPTLVTAPSPISTSSAAKPSAPAPTAKATSRPPFSEPPRSTSPVLSPSPKSPAPATTAVPSKAPGKYATQSAPSIAGFEPTPPHKELSERKLASLPKEIPSAKPPESRPPKIPVFTAAYSTDSSPRTNPNQGKGRNKWIVMGGILLAVISIGLWYFASQREKVEMVALEKEQAERRLKSEQEKSELAQQAALKEAESRQRAEAELAKKLNDAEVARLKAEEEAAAQAAARLANARGSLSITTDPVGANVKIGELAAQTSPATFPLLKIGTYPVEISMPDYEEVRVELEVKENALTDSGTIQLSRLVGALNISAEPGSSTYELQPSNTLTVFPKQLRSGVTPAALNDLAPGDYTITLAREGWTPHTQVVSIARNATTYLRWEWPNGLVNISSTPAGATVRQAGKVLGTTPLQLKDQPIGDAAYELMLDRYEPLIVSAHLEGGRTQELSARFKPEDRIFLPEEVDRKPESVGVKQPELPYYLTLENGRVEIELIVTRDGSLKAITLVESSNPDLGKFCLAAIAKWQFRPGTKSGTPVNVRMKLPFVFKAAKSK